MTRKISRSKLNKTEDTIPSSSYQKLNVQDSSMELKSDKNVSLYEEESKASEASRKSSLKHPHFSRKTQHAYQQSAVNLLNPNQ